MAPDGRHERCTETGGVSPRSSASSNTRSEKPSPAPTTPCSPPSASFSTPTHQPSAPTISVIQAMESSNPNPPSFSRPRRRRLNAEYALLGPLRLGDKPDSDLSRLPRHSPRCLKRCGHLKESVDHAAFNPKSVLSANGVQPILEVVSVGRERIQLGDQQEQRRQRAQLRVGCRDWVRLRVLSGGPIRRLPAPQLPHAKLG